MEDASPSATSNANSESDLRYRIELTPAAQRDLRKLDPHVRGKVATDLLRLELVVRVGDRKDVYRRIE